MSEQTEHNKKAILVSLEKALGVVTTACKKIDISRTQFYQWVKDDAQFRAAVNDIQNVTLHKQILDGNTTATIFYLKTKGKKRGYVERQEITGADGDNVFSIKVIDEGN